MGNKENDANYIINPKNTPEFAGKPTWNKGIITIICCVLIIDQSQERLADSSMFITKLPAIILFEL